MEGQNSGGGPVSIDVFNFAEQNMIAVRIGAALVTIPSRRLHGAVLAGTAGVPRAVRGAPQSVHSVGLSVGAVCEGSGPCMEIHGGSVETSRSGGGGREV